ncbi:MAG: alkaline phosphatase family protein [Candidatus Micrarchaeota archaeon]
MYLPNYKGRGIVNLTSTILKAFGAEPMYSLLKSLDPAKLSKSKNVVLLIIDGLGYEGLTKNGKCTTLYKNMTDRITSVFPSSTAACIPTLLTGLAPQQHAITGWFTYLNEVGEVCIPLQFVTRANRKKSLAGTGFDPKKIFDKKTIFEEIGRKSYILMPKDIGNSEFNRTMKGNTEQFGYKSFNGMLSHIKRLCLKKNKKFIYAYWPGFDRLCHEQGTKSQKTIANLKKMDRRIAELIKSLKSTNSTFIITADHGQINTEKPGRIDLADHPKMCEMLKLPLCGESRIAYCYVKHGREKEFEEYVKKNLKHACQIHKSNDLLKSNYFGLFKPNKKLAGRIGDYIIIMKRNFVIKDFIHGEKRKFYKAVHGGLSKEEMFVPLIVITC